jgi:alkylhydroperoxidase family enzyme
MRFQGKLGLAAYMPSILPLNKPDFVPDEIALVFYKTQQAYYDAKKTLAGRVYSDLHDLVFDKDLSRSGFPKILENTFSSDVPYYLIADQMDWQIGTWKVFVGLRLAQQDWRDFHADLHRWLKHQQARPDGPNGAVVAASNDYVVYWEYWQDKSVMTRSQITTLTTITEAILHNETEHIQIQADLWDNYPGLSLAGGESFNFQFIRCLETSVTSLNTMSQNSHAIKPIIKEDKTMKQGKWTRIRPLQIDEVDDYVAAAYKMGELTWGHFPNNLMKIMGHCPSLAITEVAYANSFIFDIDVFNNGRQHAGFLDRPLKELCISRTSLYNRSRYSVTHHTYIGYTLFKGQGREDEGHKKLLHLHEHEKYSYVYTERENECLNYGVKICRDPHEVSDEEFAHLKQTLVTHNRGDAPAHEMTDFDRHFIKKWASYNDQQHAILVDSQLVELTWIIAHFCLLNRWFTALQVPDESADDEANFLGVYAANIPEDLRKRNEDILKGGF